MVKTNIFNKPSFYGQILSGFIILYCAYWYFTDEKTPSNIVIWLLLGISLSIHSIWHLLMEINYDFYPIATISSIFFP